MTLACTYSGDDYPRVFPIIESALALAAGGLHGTLSGGWSAGGENQWVTTVSGLNVPEECSFTLVVKEHCTVTRV